MVIDLLIGSLMDRSGGGDVAVVLQVVSIVQHRAGDNSEADCAESPVTLIRASARDQLRSDT